MRRASAACVFALAGAAACLAAAGGGDAGLPPALVSVAYSRPVVAPLPVEIAFKAPLPNSDLASKDAWFLAGASGRRFPCQVVLVGDAKAGAAYSWAQVKALVPGAEQDLYLSHASAPQGLEEGVRIISFGKAASLETPSVTAFARAGKFRVVETASLVGKELIPLYRENLLNRQQAVELTVTDLFRHADFTLAGEAADDGFTIEEHGPVTASVVYRGKFSGEQGVEPVAFEARISLRANGVLGLELTIPAHGYESEVYRVKNLKITVPLALERAASISFGGLRDEVSGREHWTGTTTLSVSPGGSYVFADADSSVIRGTAPISWADYSDGDYGTGILWNSRRDALGLRVDYNEDLLEVMLSPPERTVAGANAAVKFEVYFLLHGGRAGWEALGTLSDSLYNPPVVTVNPEYVTAVTGLPRNSSGGPDD